MASAAASFVHASPGIGTPLRRYASALMSSSSNSKSAPAARSTLTASGTTSLPAPSHGTTAMCLGRGGFLALRDRVGTYRLLAQLVALDLAGHRLRQLGDELDHVRVLESLEARLAVLLQLGHQRVAGHRVRPRDDECLDLREPIQADSDHRAFRHRLVLEQDRFDLDRRDPQPAH